MDELRTLFTIGADASHRVQQFRDERLREITSGQGLRPLMGDGRMILHIVPLAAVTSSWQVDLAKVFELQQKFRPIGDTGMSPRYNLDGFVNERGGEHNFGYTQIFFAAAPLKRPRRPLSQHTKERNISRLVRWRNKYSTGYLITLMDYATLASRRP
ncbi:hypothetical protein ACFS07_00455 [Undibacterium arcticum]